MIMYNRDYNYRVTMTLMKRSDQGSTQLSLGYSDKCEGKLLSLAIKIMLRVILLDTIQGVMSDIKTHMAGTSIACG